MVLLRNCRKAASSFTLQMASLSVIWSNSITAKPPSRWRINTGWGLCVRSQCGGRRKGGEGGAIRGSKITTDLQHKSNIVAPTDASKKTLFPVQLDAEFSTSCWLPRTESPVLTSAASQRSQRQSTHHKQSYLWRTLHQPGSGMNSRHTGYMCKLPLSLEKNKFK